MSEENTYDAVIIGAGFFGCEIALFLRERFPHVAIIESEPEILQRASYSNQARIHAGYHYPRSLLTAARSQFNFHRFIKDHARAVVPDIATIYAIARDNSNVSAKQFAQVMQTVGAPLSPPAAGVDALFEPSMIEEVFAVTEGVFSASALREELLERISGRVRLLLESTATRIERTPDDLLRVAYSSPDGNHLILARHVFVCTYSQINSILVDSGLRPVSLKHELTEMPLIRLPAIFERMGITVMCGPFFSVMPFPDKGVHTISHVRYTPHFEWHEPSRTEPPEFFRKVPAAATRVRFMLQDASRFVPALREAVYTGESLWEIKTVLPSSETTDSRPIGVGFDHDGVRGLHYVLGAKIDNIYDVLAEITLALTRA